MQILFQEILCFRLHTSLHLTHLHLGLEIQMYTKAQIFCVVDFDGQTEYQSDAPEEKLQCAA